MESAPAKGWIFVELVIVSFFLWTVIDPIYVLTSNLALDPGYDEERHTRFIWIIMMNCMVSLTRHKIVLPSGRKIFIAYPFGKELSRSGKFCLGD